MAIVFEYPDMIYTSERGADEGLFISLILGSILSIMLLVYSLMFNKIRRNKK